MDLPTDLPAAQQQAVAAITAGIAAGYRRLQVDILAPDLKPDPLVWPIVTAFAEQRPVQVFLPDAGAAAWARREWQAVGIPESVTVSALGSRVSLTPEALILFAIPNVVSMDEIESLCSQATATQPVVVINPQFQDAATVGIGLAGRRLRERFLVTFEPVYYLQSLPNGALMRFYPKPWQLWQRQDDETYQVQSSFDRKPTADDWMAAIPLATPTNPFAQVGRLLQNLGRSMRR